jgi:hypothetical protein
MFLIFIFTRFYVFIYNSKLICTKCREIFVMSYSVLFIAN